MNDAKWVAKTESQIIAVHIRINELRVNEVHLRFHRRKLQCKEQQRPVEVHVRSYNPFDKNTVTGCPKWYDGILYISVKLFNRNFKMLRKYKDNMCNEYIVIDK